MGKDKESNSKKLYLSEFPLHEMNPVSKIVIIGKTGSGKSTLIRDVIKVFSSKIPVARIWSGTEDSNHFYAEMFPELYITSEYKEEELQEFEKRQKLAMRDNPDNARGLTIIDDCSDDPKFFSRPVFQRFYKNSRQWEGAQVLALQYGMDIKPAIRANTDYVFIFREPNENYRKTLYKNYGGIIGSYNDFCDIMDQIAEKNVALVIDNKKQSNEINECVYYYKARIHSEKFTFGCTEYQQWAEQRYNPNYQSAL